VELAKLKYFLAVAKLNHVTKAAEEMCISQPSLTQAIRSLESELGVKLIKKEGRSIVLTEYGVYLKDRLELLLPQIDSLPEQINQLKNKVNRKIKLNILAASTFVVNAIMNYRKINPEVVFDFEQSDKASDCDIVIATNGVALETTNVIKRAVKEENIYLAVPKNSVYAEKKAIELLDVKEESFIMLSSSRPFGVICNKICLASGFLPKVLFESDSPSAVQNIISMGTGVAFWPEHSWGKVNNDNITLRPIVNPVCKRDLIFELRERLPKSEYAEGFYNYLLSLM